jgi:hypothetical protein
LLVEAVEHKVEYDMNVEMSKQIQEGKFHLLQNYNNDLIRRSLKSQNINRRQNIKDKKNQMVLPKQPKLKVNPVVQDNMKFMNKLFGPVATNLKSLAAAHKRPEDLRQTQLHSADPDTKTEHRSHYGTSSVNSGHKGPNSHQGFSSGGKPKETPSGGSTKKPTQQFKPQANNTYWLGLDRATGTSSQGDSGTNQKYDLKTRLVDNMKKNTAVHIKSKSNISSDSKEAREYSDEEEGSQEAVQGGGPLVRNITTALRPNSGFKTLVPGVIKQVVPNKSLLTKQLLEMENSVAPAHHLDPRSHRESARNSAAGSYKLSSKIQQSKVMVNISKNLELGLQGGNDYARRQLESSNLKENPNLQRGSVKPYTQLLPDKANLQTLAQNLLKKRHQAD